VRPHAARLGGRQDYLCPDSGLAARYLSDRNTVWNQAAIPLLLLPRRVDSHLLTLLAGQPLPELHSTSTLGCLQVAVLARHVGVLTFSDVYFLQAVCKNHQAQPLEVGIGGEQGR